MFDSFSSSSLVSLSENRGDTAIGSGLRFPLVISTSIREYALLTLNRKNKVNVKIASHIKL